MADLFSAGGIDAGPAPARRMRGRPTMAARVSGHVEGTSPLEGLDPEQVAAATALEKRIIVRAGAGTGKTRTLVARIYHLIKDRGIAPDGIMAVTYTNKAAREIRERVGHHLGEAAALRLHLGTFHSLSARMLRRHAERFGLNKKFAIIDEDDVRRLVKDAVINTGMVKVKEPQDEVDARVVTEAALKAARAITLYESWGLTPEMIEDKSRPPRSPEEEAYAAAYVSYEDDLRRRNLVDFGGLVLKCVRLLGSEEEIRRQESHRVRHLLVDEAQDANPAQVQWTRLVSYEHKCVTSIGDEDQSIFSFQAGFPRAIDEIAGEGAATYRLVANRRCTDQILAPAVTLVGWNDRSSPKVLRSGRIGEKPALRLCSNEHEEGAHVAASIKALLEGGAKPNSIAILVRSSWAMSPVEEALLKAGIPHEIVGGGSLVEREEVRDIVAYMRLAINPKDYLAFSRIVNKPTRGLGSVAEEALLKRVDFLREMGIAEVCQTYRLPAGSHSESWRKGLDDLAGALSMLRSAAEEVTCTTLVLFDIITDEKGIGYKAFVERHGNKKDVRRRLDVIESIRRIAIEEEDPVEFVDRVVLTGKEAFRKPPKDAVRLSTMHSSKGLEWDHVICPGLDASVIPSPRAMSEMRKGNAGDPWNGPSGGGMEEERRLAHVAFTRARHTLSVSAPLMRAGRMTAPSVFLPESGLEEILSFDAYEESRMFAKGISKAKDKGGRRGFHRGR